MSPYRLLPFILLLLAACAPVPVTLPPTPPGGSPTPTLTATDGPAVTLAPVLPTDAPAAAGDDATAEPTPSRTATPVVALSGAGSILREYWLDLPGFTPDDLRASPRYPDAPDTCDRGAELATAPDFGDNFGARLRGWLIPPASGRYRFWISSDNGSELWLSTDDDFANLRQLIDFDAYAGYLSFDESPQQASAAVRLVAGQRYAVEVLLQEDESGYDHVSVAWEGPEVEPRQVIAGQYLTSEGLICDPVALATSAVVQATERVRSATQTAAAPTATATPSATFTPSVTPSVTPTPMARGSLIREYWYEVVGFFVSDLTDDPRYPANPTYCDRGAQVAITPNLADNYGARLRGYLLVPATASYTFWIASDNASELWLSRDASDDELAKIAAVETYVSRLAFDVYPEQQSNPIALRAGQPYYFEVLYKEDDFGIDEMVVAWQGGPIRERAVISGEYLSSVGLSCAQPPPPTPTPPG